MRIAEQNVLPGPRRVNLRIHLSALTLVLSAFVSGAIRHQGARCSVEAKVSIERTGTLVTFAGHRP
jgi:hypothetical protein